MTEYTVMQIIRNRAEWCNVLKSHQYKQGRGRLSQDDFSSFCCLGVAEDCVGPKLECPIKRANYGQYEDCNKETRRTNLHLDLQRALGLSDEQQNLLIVLNDGYDWNSAEFSLIAATIAQMNIYTDGKIYSPSGTEIAEYTESGHLKIAGNN